MLCLSSGEPLYTSYMSFSFLVSTIVLSFMLMS